MFTFLLYNWTYGYVLVWQRVTTASFFVFDRQFLADYLPMPGGLINYAVRFFGQFYEYTALGALVVAVLVTGLGVLLHGVLKRLMGGAALFCALLPCVVMAATLSANIIDITLGLIASVGPFLIYLRLPKGRARRIYALVAMPALYLLAGGCFWLFALWVAATEWLEGKPTANLAWKLLWPVLAVSLPLAAWRWLFMVPLRSALLRPTIFEDLHPLPAVLLYGYVALLPFWAWASRRWRVTSAEGSQRGLAAGAALLALAAVVPLWFCYQPEESELMAYQQLYQQKRWDDILSKSAGNPSLGLMPQFFTNCALVHEGKLLDEMFHYPQAYGPRGLILNFPRARNGAQDDTDRAMYDSDLFFEMGHVNAAFTLAFGHMVLCGMTYHNVSRMAECSLANGASEIARKYVTLLDRTLFHREFARRCERLLSDSKAREEYYAPLRAQMPTVDLPLLTVNFMFPLNLVECHPENRMAFDYLIALCLLDGQALPMMPHYLAHLKDAGYTRLPTHVQEALLTSEKLGGRRIPIPGFGYDPETRARFSEFLEEMKRASYRAGAHPDLGPELDGTFMYYCTFLQPRGTFNYGYVYWRLGNEFQALGMDEEALVHYRYATLLGPLNAQAQFSLADELKKQGRTEEADAVYARARKISPSRAQPSSEQDQGSPSGRAE